VNDFPKFLLEPRNDNLSPLADLLDVQYAEDDISDSIRGVTKAEKSLLRSLRQFVDANNLFSTSQRLIKKVTLRHLILSCLSELAGIPQSKHFNPQHYLQQHAQLHLLLVQAMQKLLDPYTRYEIIASAEPGDCIDLELIELSAVFQLVEVCCINLQDHAPLDDHANLCYKLIAFLTTCHYMAGSRDIQMASIGKLISAFLFSNPLIYRNSHRLPHGGSQGHYQSNKYNT